MEFLRKNHRFDLMYGGKAFAEHPYAMTQEEIAGELVTTYLLPDGLKITNKARKLGDAYEWVNWLENTSDTETAVLSDLFDCAVSLPMPLEEEHFVSGYRAEFHEVTTVYTPAGSNWGYDDFACFADRKKYDVFEGHLPVNTSKTYACFDGCSSDRQSPFFNVHKDGVGYFFAIGWSGQWNCTLSRQPESLTIKTKIEDTHFKLLPGEKLRTSSFLLLPYTGTVTESWNLWRRLLKEYFSLIGDPARASQGPLCAGIWGGMGTAAVLQRIETIRSIGLPFEYIWMDAGWYGEKTPPTPDEDAPGWFENAGDWQVSPAIHPNGLKVVADAAHAAGMKFLLWFEPERAGKDSPHAIAHPEYYLSHEECGEHLMLNLGHEAAWEYCFAMLCSHIERIGIDCYRQDFNISPLAYWRANDAADRTGIMEIKHINGLYRLWDALLERYPRLLIDNCAGGGRRIDIETLRRSVPLWRSDYQCRGNWTPEGTQCHVLSYNCWVPYSGTGSGRLYDTYRIRSAYGTSLTTNFTFTERESFGDDPEKIRWLRRRLEEYIRVRPYMSEDFYPLTEVSDRSDTWSAAQFHRPEQGDGIVQLFRRENSPYETAVFLLKGIVPDCSYVFTDADSGEKTEVAGAVLLEKGLSVSMPEKRSSRLYFYEKQ